MSLLPEAPGLLPYWLLVVCCTNLGSTDQAEDIIQVVALSVWNTVQCYQSPNFARRTFNGPTSGSEVTPFAGRVFGSWSFLSGLVRLFAAYNISDKNLYLLALCTYLIVLANYAGELLAFGTMKFGKGSAPSIFVATTSIVWMITQ
ncbi:MAG: hypothetical protein Q9196_006430, partial [Gyalolechia fulgens]